MSSEKVGETFLHLMIKSTGAGEMVHCIHK